MRSGGGTHRPGGSDSPLPNDGKGTSRSQGPTTFRVMQTNGINHVALYVEDLIRSRDFYVQTFGASVVRASDENCFLEVGNDNFLALFRRDPSHINHFCFTVDGYEPGRAAAELEQTGYEVITREDRVFVRDPDGNLVQVSASATGDDFSG